MLAIETSIRLIRATAKAKCIVAKVKQVVDPMAGASEGEGVRPFVARESESTPSDVCLLGM